MEKHNKTLRQIGRPALYFLMFNPLLCIRRCLSLFGDERDARELFGHCEVHGAVREEISVGDGFVGVLALLVKVGLKCIMY